ncbi:hypothetical protein HK405_008024, partial [Cladochytrium tenue]
WGVLLRPPDWHATGNLLANRTVDTVRALFNKHHVSTLEFLQVAGQVKATAKGPGVGDRARRPDRTARARPRPAVPAVYVSYAVAHSLGYDAILGRFKTNVARLQRRLAAALSDSGYNGDDGRAHGASGEPGTMTWWKWMTGAAPSGSSTVAGSGVAAGGALWTPGAAGAGGAE